MFSQMSFILIIIRTLSCSWFLSSLHRYWVSILARTKWHLLKVCSPQYAAQAVTNRNVIGVLLQGQGWNCSSVITLLSSHPTQWWQSDTASWLLNWGRATRVRPIIIIIWRANNPDHCRLLILEIFSMWGWESISLQSGFHCFRSHIFPRHTMLSLLHSLALCFWDLFGVQIFSKIKNQSSISLKSENSCRSNIYIHPRPVLLFCQKTFKPPIYLLPIVLQIFPRVGN